MPLDLLNVFAPLELGAFFTSARLYGRRGWPHVLPIKKYGGEPVTGTNTAKTRESGIGSRGYYSSETQNKVHA